MTDNAQIELEEDLQIIITDPATGEEEVHDKLARKREYQQTYMKEYCKKNREALTKQQKDWREKNADAHREYQRQYHKKRRDAIKAAKQAEENK